MTQKPVYLDANATAPVLPDVQSWLEDSVGLVGNPSSTHRLGRRARQVIDEARAKVAALAGATAANVIFTSGATEAINTVLCPILMDGGDRVKIGRIYASALEHPAVLAGGRLGPRGVLPVPVGGQGIVDLDALDQMLESHDHSTGRPIVAIMGANNETGIVQPTAEAFEIARRHNAYTLCDAVQIAGRLPMDRAADGATGGADFIVVSSHKIGGPQGAGALVAMRDDLAPPPLITGGGQERNHRAGTENVSALGGFGVAADWVSTHFETRDEVKVLRDRFEKGIGTISAGIEIIGENVDRLDNTTLFRLEGLPGETAAIGFDLEGVAVSSGSACSSGKVGPSHVLCAMGMSQEAARGGIRVSWSTANREPDVERALEAWERIYLRLDRRAA